MSLESFFYNHPIFRYQEFANWKGTTGHNTRMSLLYYSKAGRITNIRRGLYAVIPPGQSRDDLWVDPYLLASKAASDSQLAYHSALELHGVAYSVFEQFTFLTTEKIKPFQFQQRWYQPATIPTALQKQNLTSVEIQTMDRQGIPIAVTSLERTYVDALDRVDSSGGWEEVCRSIQQMAVLDVEKVIRYCMMLDNHLLAAKVGFFLEQRQGAFRVPDEMLTPLRQLAPASPQYIAARQQPNKLVKQWNLIVPLSILNQTWEEPDYAI